MMTHLKLFEEFYNESITKSDPEKDYEKVQKYDKKDQLKWCQILWNYYNKTLFKKKLPNGNIRFTKNMGDKFSTRGNYSPTKNEIGLNDHLFNATFNIFKRTFLHEMCHQATAKISGEEKGGHGPTWRNWMMKVGLTPNALDIEANDTYLNADELQKKQIKDKLKEKAVEKQTPTYPSENKFAKWFSKENNKWNLGMILIPNDRAGERWIFLNIDGYGTAYQIVPSTWFFEVSPEELKLLTDRKQNFDERGSRIIEYKNKKDSHRSDMRSLKKYWRSNF